MPWREPVVWLVLGLPLAMLLASAVMIRLALRDPADASSDTTRRIAQMQLADLSWDQEAARRGVKAQLDADPVRGTLRVLLAAGTEAPTALDLALRHPVQAARDRVVSLVRDGDHWRGETAAWASTQPWELMLTAPAQGWRVSGRLSAPGSHALLLPQVPR